MKPSEDAYGRQLLAQFHNQKPTAEIIERDDGLIDFGSEAGLYFTEYEDWSPVEQKAISLVKGKVLDIGCGAGRHSLYLQEKGFDVTGIDNSPGAIEVYKLRGLKKAEVLPIEKTDKLPENSFDTIIMFGNNFGLFGNPENTKKILKKFTRITTEKAQIIAGTLNPYKTEDPNHLAYHELNRKRNRMPGQATIRIRYERAVGNWFDYLFVSPEEMREIVKDTDWQIREFIESKGAHFFGVIEKKILEK
jgi:SAM-dependent methyltransferase